MTNPFNDLPEHQRQWFIDYYKLLAVWEHLGYDPDDFPRLRDGPIRKPTPWQDTNHHVNRKLEEARLLVEGSYGPHWRRWQDYRVVCYVMDMDGGVEEFEPDYRQIQVRGFRVCRDCKCDKCYQVGLCGLGCLNPDKQCQNVR